MHVNERAVVFYGKCNLNKSLNCTYIVHTSYDKVVLLCLKQVANGSKEKGIQGVYKTE
jgi:hypothetical protein